MAGSNEELRARLAEVLALRREAENEPLESLGRTQAQGSFKDSAVMFFHDFGDETLAALAPAQEPAGGGEACDRCDGDGFVERGAEHDDGGQVTRPCPKCANTAPTPTPQGVSEEVVERAMDAFCAKPGDWLRDSMRAALEAVWPTAAGAAPEGQKWPARFGCNGPEGTFWTDDSELANKLIRAAFDRDEWTVTDMQEPEV